MSENERKEVISIYLKKAEKKSFELHYDEISDEECIEILKGCIESIKMKIEENDIF